MREYTTFCAAEGKMSLVIHCFLYAHKETLKVYIQKLIAVLHVGGQKSGRWEGRY